MPQVPSQRFGRTFEKHWNTREAPDLQQALHRVLDVLNTHRNVPPVEDVANLSTDRAAHAATADNKRLGAALEHIKEMQDAAPPKPKVRTNSEKIGDKPNGRRQGRPSGQPNKKKIAHAAE